MRKAFTLVELLVVIAIISLLASILLSPLSKVRDSVKSTVCMSREQEIGIALALYSTDYNGLYPPAIYGCQGTSSQWTYDRYLQVYTGDIVSLPPAAGDGEDPNRDIFSCPSDEESRYIGRPRSYSLSVWLAGSGRPVRQLENETMGYSSCLIVDKVPRPGNTFILAEWHAWWNRRLGNCPGAFIRRHEYRYGWYSLPDHPAPIGNPSHGSNHNFLFVDGHIKSLDATDANKSEYWDLMN